MIVTLIIASRFKNSSHIEQLFLNLLRPAHRTFQKQWKGMGSKHSIDNNRIRSNSNDMERLKFFTQKQRSNEILFVC